MKTGCGGLGRGRGAFLLLPVGSPWRLAGEGVQPGSGFRAHTGLSSVWTVSRPA